MGTRISAHFIDPKNLHLNVLPSATQKAFLLCKNFSFLSHSWYLAGGTALALQVGHRESLDLDFFIPKAKFQELTFEKKLLATEKWSTGLQREGTLYGKLLGAKMSFIAYPFFHPSNQYLRCGNIKILLPHDIAAMKVIAISQRGRKRDFFDMYWYCKNCESLSEVVRRALRQYPQDHNIAHILKSFAYFEDAESDPDPKIFFKASWKEVKNYFRSEAVRLARKLLHLE